MLDFDNDTFDERNDSDEYEYNRLITIADKAWLLDIDGDDVWLPKSQCSIDIKRKMIAVPLWLAEDKGLV